MEVRSRSNEHVTVTVSPTVSVSLSPDTCRPVITHCDRQAWNIICSFLVPLNRVVVTANAEGTPIPGQQYRISCVVLYPEGITIPAVQWYNSEGLISSGDGIVVGNPVVSSGNITSHLQFNPFRTAHGSRFSCTATVTSQTPPNNISKTADVNIVIGGEPLTLAKLQVNARSWLVKLSHHIASH